MYSVFVRFFRAKNLYPYPRAAGVEWLSRWFYHLRRKFAHSDLFIISTDALCLTIILKSAERCQLREVLWMTQCSRLWNHEAIEGYNILPVVPDLLYTDVSLKASLSTEKTVISNGTCLEFGFCVLFEYFPPILCWYSQLQWFVVKKKLSGLKSFFWRVESKATL